MLEQYIGNRVKLICIGDTYAVQVHVDAFLDEATEWQTVAMNLSREAALERVASIVMNIADDPAA